MQRVFVLTSTHQPMMPCHPARARALLKAGKAAVYRRYPFTIILQERDVGDTQPVAVKIDPGSTVTGIALVADFQRGKCVVWAAELTHRGRAIRNALQFRRQVRRSRRQRKTRYRPARFQNRRRPKGWLPPSLMSRVHNITTWVGRLSRFSPIINISMELVRFDTQALYKPEISGTEYQQGELMGYEVREYLLKKWGRTCAYCGVHHTPLEVEHITPRSRGGSNRVSNLTLACHACNQRKGNQTAAEFGFPAIQTQALRSLTDTAAVNATRWRLYEALQASGVAVEVGTGGRTKYNRTTQGYPKTHWLDAVCVGASGARVYVSPTHAPLMITAMGRGNRQMCSMDKYGFPRTSPKSHKRVHGFQTGDIVKAVVATGTKVGTYVGRVTIRSSGSFNIKTRAGTVQGIHYTCCTLLHTSDGYRYEKGEAAESIRVPTFG